LPESTDFGGLDNIFRMEVEMAYESKIEGLSIPVELKKTLIEKFESYIARYMKQLPQRDLEHFYIQNWKILIQRK
jgi:hypothetical protein